MITIFFQKLPFADVYGITHKSNDGNYTVLINTNIALSSQQIVNAIRHEMRHIRLNHFDSNRPLTEIEEEAISD